MTFTPRSAIRIQSLHFQDTGTYNPMFYRPMVTSVTADAIDNLIERLDQQDVRKITPATTSGFSLGIIHPDPIPRDLVPIANGWESRRIRFVLHVFIDQHALNVTEEFYFQGFTDHIGITGRGSIDPNMLLIVNNYVKIGTLTNYDTQGGIHYDRRIIESGQIINGEVVYQNLGTNTYSLRPSEVFLGIQSAYILNEQIDNAPTFDNRFVLNNKSLLNNKYHVNPASYVAVVTHNHCTAALNNQMHPYGVSDLFTATSNLLLGGQQQPPMNTFFRTIKNLKGGVTSGTIFTMSELELLDPNVSYVTNYLSVGPVHQAQFHQTGQTAYWNDANLEVQWATILGNAVPALLMELMLSKLTFMATNHVVGGMPVVNLLQGMTITGAEMTQCFETFKTRLIMEILNDLSYGNNHLYNLTMQIDIFGETRISLALNSNPPVEYVVPTFCDSIITPLMTQDRNNFMNVATDVCTVVNQVQEAVGSHYATVNPRTYL